MGNTVTTRQENILLSNLKTPFIKTQLDLITDDLIIYSTADINKNCVGTGGQHFPLTPYERGVVERIVAGEARGESLEGQMLVAQCILNSCEKDGLQPSQVRIKYKYSGYSENVTESVKQAIVNVFDNGEMIVGEPIQYFYNPTLVTSEFHESLTFVIQSGSHKFFMSNT